MISEHFRLVLKCKGGHCFDLCLVDFFQLSGGLTISMASLDTLDLRERAKRKLAKVISELRCKIWSCGLAIVYADASYMLISHSRLPFPLPSERKGLPQQTLAADEMRVQ